MHQYFIPFYGWTIFHCMTILHFYLSNQQLMDVWVVLAFWLLRIMLLCKKIFYGFSAFYWFSFRICYENLCTSFWANLFFFFFFFKCIPRSRISGSYRVTFWGTTRFSKWLHRLHSHQQGMRAPIYPCPYQHLCLFYYSHSNKCKVASHFNFDSYFFNDQWYWTFFMFIGHLYIFFGVMSV